MWCACACWVWAPDGCDSCTEVPLLRSLRPLNTTSRTVGGRRKAESLAQPRSPPSAHQPLGQGHVSPSVHCALWHTLRPAPTSKPAGKGRGVRRWRRVSQGSGGTSHQSRTRPGTSTAAPRPARLHAAGEPRKGPSTGGPRHNLTCNTQLSAVRKPAALSGSGVCHCSEGGDLIREQGFHRLKKHRTKVDRTLTATLSLVSGRSHSKTYHKKSAAGSPGESPVTARAPSLPVQGLVPRPSVAGGAATRDARGPPPAGASGSPREGTTSSHSHPDRRFSPAADATVFSADSTV